MRAVRSLAGVGYVVSAFVLAACPDTDTGGPADVAEVTGDAMDVTFVNDAGDIDASFEVVDPGWPACVTGAEPGCACEQNSDCNSGFCVPSGEGSICTATCVTSCPADFACAPVATGVDVTYICVPLYPTLCRPCDGNADCAALGDVGGRCLPADPEGDGARFCGGNCGVGATCPEGYRCNKVEIGGTEVAQCVPESGECACNDLAILDEAASGCRRDNEHGTCLGVRACSEDGLTDCNAPVPSDEICNGVDDDCDGRTDDFAPEPCAIENVYGSCAGTRSCVGGQWSQCLGTPPGPELCDGADNDCDGTTDEGTPDSDGDGIKDECEADDDADGVPDVSDNCPALANPGQETCDDDALGNACDADDDGDGTADDADCAPCDAAIHPGAQDSCNSQDDDCDALEDEDCHTRLRAVSFASGFVLDGRSTSHRLSWTLSTPVTTGLGQSSSYGLRPIRHVGALP